MHTLPMRQTCCLQCCPVHGLDCLFTSDRHKKRRKEKRENLTKRRNAGLNSIKSVRTPDQFFFICKALLLYCTLTTSCIDYENQMVKCETCFCWGKQQEQHTQMHSFQKHCEILDMTEFILHSKHLDWPNVFFLYTGAFVASSKLICTVTPVAQLKWMSLANSRQRVWCYHKLLNT